MIDIYEEIFDDYKKYITENSEYSPKVFKYNTNTSTYFPLITFILANNIDTDNCTIDNIEFYEQQYFTINIYAKNKNIVKDNLSKVIASQIIIDELTRLTNQYFKGLNMKRTLCSPTPNLDTSVLRQTIQYQCLVGNARKNMIRR